MTIARVRYVRLALGALALFLTGHAAGQAPQTKRPLTHADYDAWRSIQGQQIAPDGRHVAYALQPQEGDGEVVVRNLESGKEWRHPRGSRPLMPATLPASSLKGKGGAEPRQGKLAFTADSRYLVFQTTPSKADGAKRVGRDGMAILDLTSGKFTSIPDVRTFEVPPDGPALVVYHRPAPGEKPAPTGKGKKGEQPEPPKPRTEGTDLVLRKLDGGAERVFKDVTEFTLAKDGRTLVFASAGRVAPKALYAVETMHPGEPRALRNDNARYYRFAWDEKHKQLAFFAESQDPKATAKVTLCVWDRDASDRGVALLGSTLLMSGAPSVATKMLPWSRRAVNEAIDSGVRAVVAGPAGLRDGARLVDTAAVAFSRDGTKLFFGVAPEAKKQPPDKVAVELWHWKDDFIPPMQKARYGRENARTFRAVAHLDTGKVVQLADAAMADVSPAPAGPWALGDDDRPYRTLVGFDANYSDHYLVDLRNGSRKPLLKKHAGGVSWSAGGKHALHFADKHWHALPIPDGKAVNLTANLKAGFAVEDFDAPSAPPPYGVAGWSADNKDVFLYDRHDVWQVAADGSGAKNLTGGHGRKHGLQLRLVTPETGRRTFDTTKPLLLRAEDLKTRDTGFYRLRPGGAPEKLVMAAKGFGPLVKAKEADVYLLTASTFRDFPDLHIAWNGFKDVKKVSHANPQQANYAWGDAELVHFKNLDGAALQGILIKPENFDPKKKYPMVVYIYEKLSQNLHGHVPPRPGTSINFTYFASNGYLVFLPDVVYKVGYPGQSALKCVLPGVQAVVDRGFVDEKAIGIQGHSWGGYQIAYMLTQTDRFKAAAAGAPVSNMISAYGGIRWGTGLPRQFQYERTQSRIGGTLWDLPMRFIENSPVLMADRVKTPLLMLHNDGDDAVPWQQGIEYFLALRRLGKETYLFNYPGEAHGLRKRSNQMDYTARMQEFFDHHLRGAPKPAWMERGIPYRPRGPEKKGPAEGDDYQEMD